VRIRAQMRIGGMFVQLKLNLIDTGLRQAGLGNRGDIFGLVQLGQAAGSRHAAKSLERQGLLNGVTRNRTNPCSYRITAVRKNEPVPDRSPTGGAARENNECLNLRDGSVRLYFLSSDGSGIPRELESKICTAQPPVHRILERPLPVGFLSPAGFTGRFGAVGSAMDGVAVTPWHAPGAPGKRGGPSTGVQP